MENDSDRIVNEFINNDCSRGESKADILHRSSKPFCFGGHFVQRQQITIETEDTTDTLASKLIEKLSYNVSTGLYVFDVQGGKVNKTAIVPILLRTDEESKHYQCVATVYRSSTGGGKKVLMRLVTRSLTGVCDNCYYYSQCVVNSSKGQPEQLKSQTPTKLTENVFPCRMNYTFDQLQFLVFIPTSIQTTERESNHSLRLNDSI